jgi:hypothetical protein
METLADRPKPQKPLLSLSIAGMLCLGVIGSSAYAEESSQNPPPYLAQVVSHGFFEPSEAEGWFDKIDESVWSDVGIELSAQRVGGGELPALVIQGQFLKPADAEAWFEAAGENAWNSDPVIASVSEWHDTTSPSTAEFLAEYDRGSAASGQGLDPGIGPSTGTVGKGE